MKKLSLMLLVLLVGCHSNKPASPKKPAPPKRQVSKQSVTAPEKQFRIVAQEYKNGIFSMRWEGGKPPYMVEWAQTYDRSLNVTNVTWICLEETTNTFFSVGIGGYPLSFLRVESESTNVVDKAQVARLLARKPIKAVFPPLPPMPTERKVKQRNR